MSQAEHEIFNAALALPASARAQLAEKLLDSLPEDTRAAIEAAWDVEVESRVLGYREGKIDTIPGDEVLAPYLARKKS